MVVVAVSEPEVPVTVTVEVPTVAELPAVNVITLLPVVGLVPKVAVTPVGKPEATSVTLPLKLFTSVTVIVSVAVLPGVTDSVLDDGAMVKLPVDAALTVNAIVVVSVSVPEVPVMVTVEVPAVAELLAVNVTTLLPVVGLVPKAAVTPVGKPEAASVTLPLKLFTSVTVTVSVAVLPAVTDSVLDEGARVKLAVVVVAITG